jgi:nucleotide-binding universal stress UspA family protein
MLGWEESNMAKTKVMVAVRDSSSAEESTPLGCQLAAWTGGELIALHVVQVPWATPLDLAEGLIDKEGRQILAQATCAAAGKVPGGFSTRLVRARNTGEAIVLEEREQGVALLVPRHHRNHELSEFFFGSTMRYVAHHAPCKVIVLIPVRDARQRQPGAERSGMASARTDAV